MLKVKDRVNILDGKGVILAQGTIYNINEYRPPETMYAVDVDGYSDDLLFFGENRLELIKK